MLLIFLYKHNFFFAITRCDTTKEELPSNSTIIACSVFIEPSRLGG